MVRGTTRSVPARCVPSTTPEQPGVPSMDMYSARALVLRPALMLQSHSLRPSFSTKP